MDDSWLNHGDLAEENIEVVKKWRLEIIVSACSSRQSSF
jgi:hypothetical protein